MNQRTTLYGVALVVLAVVVLLTVHSWQQSHHRSADQEILIRKAHAK